MWVHFARSSMWRRALSQLLEKRVDVALPPPGTVLAQCFHSTRCEGKSRDLRVAEARFVEKVCRVVRRRGEWGTGTVSELERLNIRLRAKVVNKVLRGLENAETAHRFFLWARTQPSFHHSLQAYHAIIEIMGAAQNFDAQHQLLQDMRHQGLQANTSTFNILLLGFSRANLTDKVVETFNVMVRSGWSPNAFTFKCVIRSLVWSGRALEALSIHTKMVEFGFVPDNFTYNGLIEGLCTAGCVDEAFVIFQEMEDRGLSPDAVAHGALIKALDTKGRIDEACRMFQEMTGKNLRSVVNTHKGVMGVFSKRRKEDLNAATIVPETLNPNLLANPCAKIGSFSTPSLSTRG